MTDLAGGDKYKIPWYTEYVKGNKVRPTLVMAALGRCQLSTVNLVRVGA